MKKTLLSSMIIILMGLLGACSSNTSDKASLPEQSASENETATPVAIEVPDTLGKTYDAVEVIPEFPGGTEALLSFIKDNLKYPQKAIDEQTEGRVIVQFVIDKTGKVSSPEVIRGVTSELDQAALDIVSALPDWKPGEQDGQKVNVKYTLPVVFKLKYGNAEPIDLSLKIRYGSRGKPRSFEFSPRTVHNFCTIYPLSAYEKITLLYRSFSGSIRLEKSCRYSRRNHTIYL